VKSAAVATGGAVKSAAVATGRATKSAALATGRAVKAGAEWTDETAGQVNVLVWSGRWIEKEHVRRAGGTGLGILKEAGIASGKSLTVTADHFTLGLIDLVHEPSQRYQQEAIRSGDAMTLIGYGAGKVSAECFQAVLGGKALQLASKARYVGKAVHALGRVVQAGRVPISVGMAGYGAYNAGAAVAHFQEGDYMTGTHRAGRAGISFLFAAEMIKPYMNKYHYMGESEYNAMMRQNGARSILNTDPSLESKSVFYSNRTYEHNVVEGALRIGRLHPDVSYPPPTRVAVVRGFGYRWASAGQAIEGSFVNDARQFISGVGAPQPPLLGIHPVGYDAFAVGAREAGALATFCGAQANEPATGNSLGSHSPSGLFGEPFPSLGSFTRDHVAERKSRKHGR